MLHDIRRARTAAVAATLILLGVNSTVHAQSSEHGPRWQGFFGCWGVTGKGTAQDSELGDRLVCITPTADADVAEAIDFLE